MFKQMRLKPKLIVTFLLCALITGGTGFLGVFYTSEVGEGGKYIALKLVPLGDAAMEITLSASRAYLILEEAINQKASATEIQEAWKALDKSLWYADAILQGGKNDAGLFYASQNPQVLEKISKVKEKLKKFIDIAHQRYEFRESFKVGGIIDQDSDEIYYRVQEKLSNITQHYSGRRTLLITRLAGDAQYLAANAHVFLEELLSGDKKNKLEDIIADFKKAIINVRSINILTREKDPEIIEGITILIKIAKKRVHDAEQSIAMDQESEQKFNMLFKAFTQEADEAKKLIWEQIAKGSIGLEDQLEQAKWTLLLFSLIAILLSICFATFLTRSVTRQVGGDPLDLIEIASEVAKGKINRSFQTNGKSLTGIKAAMSQMVESLKAKQRLAEEIALGDLHTEVQLASEDDLLGIALQKMMTNLRQKVKIAESVAEGNLTIRVPLASDQDTLGKSLRKMTESLKGKQKLADEIAHGDLTKDVQLASNHDLLGIALQKMLTNLRDKVRIAEAVSAGDFTIPVPLASEQDTLGKSLRNMSESLKVKQRLTEKIAHGDLTKDVQLASKKDLLGIALQKMVDNLRRKVAIAEAVAEGDLTVRVPLASKQDTLGKSLRKMTENLNQLLHEIVDGSTALAVASQELSTISKQMASSSTEASAQTDSVAQSIVKMTANISQMVMSSKEIGDNIHTISATSDETAQSMEAANKQVEEMSNSIQEVASRAVDAAQIATNAKETSRSASGRGEKLNISALQIGEVTEIIKEIAQQTNLLALNANIEAASAGDAGRGFAVVANEIKDLAKESSKAAEEISCKISTIQTDTQESVQAFRNMVEITEQINLSSQEIQNLSQQQSLNAGLVQDSIMESSKGSEETAKSIDDIARAIEKFSLNNRKLEKGSAEISSNISSVSQLNQEANSAVESINLEASQLAQIAVQLKASSRKFKLAD